MDANVNLNDVALLVRVIQTRSFSAAARERGVPVSTVSRKISRLEQALGLRLLERTTRRLVLTDAGRRYFAHAERAIEDLAEGGAVVRELQTEPRGRVRILAPVTLGGVITDVLVSFLARYPAVGVDLELAERTLDLGSETFDLAIITGRVDTSDFIARPLWRSSRKLLFASPRYLEERGTPRTIADLTRHACIATRGGDGTATWTLARNRVTKRFAFAPRLYVSESSAAHRAARAGVGIAMLPEVLCVEDVAHGHLVRVLPRFEGQVGGVALLYRAHRSVTAAIRACIDHFLSELPASDPAG